MRTRAYRPEVSDCLEDRSLLSGIAGPSADPVVFSRRQLNRIAEHIEMGFNLFARYRDLSQLRGEIDDVVVMIPFGRVDGVRPSIERILFRMRRDIFAHVPLAFRTARNDVFDTIRADMQARIQAGDLVVR